MHLTPLDSSPSRADSSDMGFAPSVCAPAADLAETNYATCEELVAAGPGICDSLAGIVVTNDQGLGCDLIGETLGPTIGMASEAIRSFEQEANRAGVISECQCVLPSVSACRARVCFLHWFN